MCLCANCCWRLPGHGSSWIKLDKPQTDQMSFSWYDQWFTRDLNDHGADVLLVNVARLVAPAVLCYVSRSAITAVLTSKLACCI
jgi:hypothetical protein